MPGMSIKPGHMSSCACADYLPLHKRVRPHAYALPTDATFSAAKDEARHFKRQPQCLEPVIVPTKNTSTGGLERAFEGKPPYREGRNRYARAKAVVAALCYFVMRTQNRTQPGHPIRIFPGRSRGSQTENEARKNWLGQLREPVSEK